MKGFRATAWCNGQGSYGLKVSVRDRNTYFRRERGRVTLLLPDGSTVQANIAKNSFWNGTCRELIGIGIGKWLLASGLAPWPLGNPPTVRVHPKEPSVFEVTLD